MKSWYAFDADGKIVMSGACPESDLHLQGAPGLTVLSGVARVGEVYREPSGLLVPLPPRPGSHFVFDFKLKRWVDPRGPEELWAAVRDKRDSLLAQSDWTDLASSRERLGEEVYGLWRAYRQALRDITQQSDPAAIVWPDKP